MIRQNLVRSLRPAVRSSVSSHRTISSTAVRKAEGDTGAPRSGGSAQSDAFTKRENADEARYVMQKEKEKLEALKEKIKEHRKHLDNLDDHIDTTLKEGADPKASK